MIEAAADRAFVAAAEGGDGGLRKLLVKTAGAPPEDAAADGAEPLFVADGSSSSAMGVEEEVEFTETGVESGVDAA
jgi:hypothetical protein